MTCAKRQGDLAVVLVNVHDPHNISAVLRSCDAVGVQSVYVAYTDENLSRERLRLGRKSSASAWKWVDVYYFESLDECLSAVRAKYKRILATHLGKKTQSLYAMDLTVPTALMFGNEHSGLSPEALANADADIFIPQMGMIRSLNISVACAVSLYEAMRQRQAQGYYDLNPTLTDLETQQLVDEFVSRHVSRQKRKTVPKKPAT